MLPCACCSRGLSAGPAAGGAPPTLPKGFWDAKRSRTAVSLHAVGMLDTNCVMVCDLEEREAVIVDPGGEPEVLLAAARALSVPVREIVVTHGHLDHFYAVPGLVAALEVPVRLHEADRPLWSLAGAQCGMFGLPELDFEGVDPEWAAEGDPVACGGRLLHTPGHTQGSSCVWFEEDGLLCSGDTLFFGSVGRTDLPGGDHGELLRSVQRTLLPLLDGRADGVAVVPGHGPCTTLAFEERSNPYLSRL